MNKESKPFTLQEVSEFLLGNEPLDGVWFGERHPKLDGAFWWRVHLRRALDICDARDSKNIAAKRTQKGCGGRLYREFPRKLVADFYDEGDRELFIAMRNALPDLLAALEAFSDVAECANSQWSDDYLWEKWGLNEKMNKGRAFLAKLTTEKKADQ